MHIQSYRPTLDARNNRFIDRLVRHVCQCSGAQHTGNRRLCEVVTGRSDAPRRRQLCRCSCVSIADWLAVPSPVDLCPRQLCRQVHYHSIPPRVFSFSGAVCCQASFSGGGRLHWPLTCVYVPASPRAHVWPRLAPLRRLNAGRSAGTAEVRRRSSGT